MKYPLPAKDVKSLLKLYCSHLDLYSTGNSITLKSTKWVLECFLYQQMNKRTSQYEAQS